MKCRLLLAALAAGAVLGSCEKSVAPPSFAGTFVLTTLFAASPPPVVLYVQSTRTTITSRSEIFADTLVVGVDGTWQERTTYRFTENPETAPVVTYPTASGFGIWAVDTAGVLTFRQGSAIGGMLYNLNLQPGTVVETSGDALQFKNVLQFGLDWKPRFTRLP